MDRFSKLNLLLTLFTLIKTGSYVATLIVMMTWSITYHSWMGFVLLCWSCVIWMMPNSRQACLRSSPFLVLYAMSLLLTQYVVSLNVYDLPDPAELNYLDELGLRFEPYDTAYKSLVIKLAYTLVFCITLRQHMEERSQLMATLQSERVANETAAQDAAQDAAPTSSPHEFVASGSTAAGLLARNHSVDARRRRASIIRQLGVWPVDMHPSLMKILDQTQQFLCKYWILIVTLLLMIMSMSGTKVVLYRIVYMFMFLNFVLVFQISYRTWRRLMYSFWLLVIVYSMAVLVAIYTYQFRDFKYYWEEFLHVPLRWQIAIGLEEFKHDPLLLFKQLFTPTFFIIITIIQLHFFHQEFLKLSDLDQVNSVPVTPILSEATESTVAESAVSGPSSGNHPSSSSKQPKKQMTSKSSKETLPQSFDTLASPSKESQKSSDSDQITITMEPNTQAIEPVFSSSASLTGAAAPLRKSARSDLSANVTSESSRPESIRPVQPKKTPNTFASNIDPLVEEIRSESPLFGISTESLLHMLWPTLIVVYELFWRILELHIMKLVFICAMIAALNEVSFCSLCFVILSSTCHELFFTLSPLSPIQISLINFVFIVLLVIALSMQTFEKSICYFLGVWASILILFKMFYQLDVVQDMNWFSTCDVSLIRNPFIHFSQFSERSFHPPSPPTCAASARNSRRNHIVSAIQ